MRFRAAAQRSAVSMVKSRKLPSGPSLPDQRLAALLVAIGKDQSGAFERYALVHELEEIQRACLRLPTVPMAGEPFRKLLIQFRKNTAERRKLREQLRPLREDILLAGLLRQNPEAAESHLRAALQDNVDIISDPTESEASEDRDIAFLLDKGDYRKRHVHKLAVEPFLRFLEEHDVVPSRKLPLNRMMEALFDWLGIERTLRPTDVGIRTIARDLRKKS